jgi:magnesium chelatase family protein
MILGELSLDGSATPVAGVLPAAIAANAAGRGLICPAVSGGEAAWASEGLDILAPENLVQLVNHFKGTQVLSRPAAKRLEAPVGLLDLRDIKGQESAKRALEVIAAGGHNLLMIGPPGSGKSMLAERLPLIMPPMDAREMLEVSMIASVAGELAGGGLSENRPFRNPHHSASQAALVGGGVRARPGEMALAHNGVLFIDELPEFSPRVLDSMRQPIETGQTVIARANYHVTYPSRFQLVAAMNPCKCGHAGEPGHTCRRGVRCAQDYRGRISGPLLDRIDVQIEVPAVRAFDLSLPAPKEGSAEAARRVARARRIQKERYASMGLSHVRMNSQADGEVLEAVAMPDQAGLALLQDAAQAIGLTARGYHRVLRVARTLADLEGCDKVGRIQIAEAVSYRQITYTRGASISAVA